MDLNGFTLYFSIRRGWTPPKFLGRIRIKIDGPTKNLPVCPLVRHEVQNIDMYITYMYMYMYMCVYIYMLLYTYTYIHITSFNWLKMGYCSEQIIMHL